MKLLLSAIFAFPMFAVAQVSVGDLNVICSGYNIGSFNLTKSGRHATYNGVPMSIGREGLYRTPDGRPIDIRIFSDRTASVTFYTVGYPGNQDMVITMARCSGDTHQYRLQYDRKGYPLYTIVPKDNQAQNRYRN